MEYPTPNPGPCRVCKKRIWHGGTECSECRTRRMRREDKADRDARAVKRLRQQLAAAQAEHEYLFQLCKSDKYFCDAIERLKKVGEIYGADVIDTLTEQLAAAQAEKKCLHGLLLQFLSDTDIQEALNQKGGE